MTPLETWALTQRFPWNKHITCSPQTEKYTMKTLISSFLFCLGYLFITLGVLVVALFINEIFTQPGFRMWILPLPLIGALASAHQGITLIKKSFLPGIPATFALKKGEMVEVITTEDSSINTVDDVVWLLQHPFKKPKAVRFTEKQCVFRGYRYYFDGTNLKSVMPTKE